MTDTPNSLLSLYRLIQQQRYSIIEPQLAHLSESIAQTLSAISQQEQAWLAIENATFCCFSRTFARDARDLLLTDDFETFIEQLEATAGVNDLDITAKSLLVIEPKHWQLRTLTVPLRILRHQVLTQPRYTYRIKLALGNWQHNLTGTILAADSAVRQLRSFGAWQSQSYQAQWIELHHQVEGADFQLDLDPSQQAQLRQEIGCLTCYVGSLICIRQLTAGFTYP